MNLNESSSLGIITEKSGLLRRLGLFTTMMIVVGAVIGSGIFRKPGVMAGELGSPEVLLAVWILGGIITLFGALSNAEVASLIPETGGQYVYFEKMYGSFPAYLYGWSVFSVIQTGSIAAISVVFAEYFARFFLIDGLSVNSSLLSFHIPFIGDIRPTFELHIKLIAASLVALLTGINYLGVRFGGGVQNIFTVAKVVAMLLLIGLAFIIPNVGQAQNLVTDSSVIATGTIGILGIAAALQGAFWSYDGWNNVTYIAGEVRDPQRNIPRALIFGLGTIIIVYLLINLAYAYVLPVDEMAASKLVASDVADKLFDGGGKWIALLVMISTFGTTNGTIMVSARVYFSMARRNVFPRFLGQTHQRFKTPGSSLIVQASWSILLIFSGTFDTLTDMLIFISWIFYAAGAYGLFILRKNYPDVKRPYKVPLYPYIPALFIIFAVTYLILTLYNDVVTYQEAIAQGEPAIINSGLGLLLVLLGAPIYFFYRRRTSQNNEDE